MPQTWFAVDIAVDILPRYTSLIGRAGVFFALPRVRLVFSESVKDIQLENGSPVGRPASSKGSNAVWRIASCILRSHSSISIALQASVADLAAILMPSDCRVCGAALANSSRVRICQVCVDRLQPNSDAVLNPLCTRCGDALGMESARFGASMGVTECTMCRLAPPEFDRAVAFSDYDSEMREMLHLLKFNGMRGVAEHVLGKGLATAVQTLREDASDEVLVIPVPLFSAKKKERGFNQADLLAAAALKHLQEVEPRWNLRLQENALERTKDTRALYALNPSQRRHSLRGAFRVADAAAIRGREILLIDDIMTTGATARACARVLKRAGATRVWVATTAKAQPESVRGAVQFSAESFAMWDMSARATGVLEPADDRRLRF